MISIFDEDGWEEIELRIGYAYKKEYYDPDEKKHKYAFYYSSSDGTSKRAINEDTYDFLLENYGL